MIQPSAVTSRHLSAATASTGDNFDTRHGAGFGARSAVADALGGSGDAARGFAAFRCRFATLKPLSQQK